MNSALIKLISACVGALIAAAICLHWLTAGTDEIVWGNSSTESSEIMEGRPDAVGSVPFLISKHRCWTGDAPADMVGVLPTHSILTLPGKHAATYESDVWTGRALDLVLGGKVTPGLRVHAFCR